MVLTEKEKKEYLINYQPTLRFPSVTILLLLFASGVYGIAVLTGLNYLGYTHIVFNNMQKILFFLILAFIIMQLIMYTFKKGHEK
jgi:p-aminobenzoyl-glutamate transporter AbgT